MRQIRTRDGRIHDAGAQRTQKRLAKQRAGGRQQTQKKYCSWGVVVENFLHQQGQRLNGVSAADGGFLMTHRVSTTTTTQDNFVVGYATHVTPVSACSATVLRD